MLVKYKNLTNGLITEEKDLFVSQLKGKFLYINENFIYSVVDCIQRAISRENVIGIEEKGCRTQENVRSNIMNFLNEIKRFSQAPNYYKPNIHLDLESFGGESLKFLLRANPQDLVEFAESYDTTIPDVSRDRIYEVTGFIFDAMREATERGLNGERCQTQKERIAEETWDAEYSKKPPTTVSNPEEFKLDSNKIKKSVTIKV